MSKLVVDGDAVVARLRDWLDLRSTGGATVGRLWPPYQPLGDELPPVSAMPMELLPSAWRDWIDDASERLQVPAEMIATPALVAAGAVIGRQVAILPKRRDDWHEVANLWGAVVGRPGTLKSPAVDEGTRHIRRLAATARKAHESDARRTAIERRQIAVSIRRKEHWGASAKGDPQAAAEEIVALEDAAAMLGKSERRYLTQDATIEKLGELLVDNPRGLLVLRDELYGWLATFDRAGREGEREFFLEAWSAKQSYTCDRIGRGTVHIPSPCISVLGTIQPGKLKSLIAGATGEGVGDDGLLQRFQLVAWPDVPGDWSNIDRWPASAARRRASETFDYLDNLDPAGVGASTENCPVPALRFVEDAQELFDAWRAELEQRLRGDEMSRTPSYEAHCAKYRKLMPALALISHLVDGGTGPVTLDAARRAADLVDYYDHHARRVYAVELSPGLVAARALGERILAARAYEGMSVRDLKQREWSMLSTSALVEEALDRLTELGWLFVEAVKTGEAGRETRVLHLRPDLPKGGA